MLVTGLKDEKFIYDMFFLFINDIDWVFIDICC